MSKNDENLLSFLDNKSLSYGYIICKCTLVDCIYMTNDYIENIKKNNYNEYLFGEYEVGRYAFILKDIVYLDDPIFVKGSLGIWSYYKDLEIMEFMKDIEYGWLDKNGSRYINDFTTFSNDYRLQSPSCLIQSKLGVCWDQVELERYYFRGYDIKTYFLVYYDDDKCPTHTFLTYKKNEKYYWFEHSYEKFRGIHEYNSLKELLIDVRSKFIEDELDNHFMKDQLCLYEYKRPPYFISVQEFYRFQEKSFPIDLDSF